MISTMSLWEIQARSLPLIMQALILLLAVLDIGKLVQIVKEGKRLDGESHRLGSVAALEEVDRELLSWGALPTSSSNGHSVQAALLLAWATFLCLSNSAAENGGRLSASRPVSECLISWNRYCSKKPCQVL